jgi:hypothetical protein
LFWELKSWVVANDLADTSFDLKNIFWVYTYYESPNPQVKLLLTNSCLSLYVAIFELIRILHEFNGLTFSKPTTINIRPPIGTNSNIRLR